MTISRLRLPIGRGGNQSDIYRIPITVLKTLLDGYPAEPEHRAPLRRKTFYPKDILYMTHLSEPVRRSKLKKRNLKSVFGKESSIAWAKHRLLSAATPGTPDDMLQCPALPASRSHAKSNRCTVFSSSRTSENIQATTAQVGKFLNHSASSTSTTMGANLVSVSSHRECLPLIFG